MPGTTLPPFPDDVPTHPLLIIDYHLISQGDKQEIDRLWEASTSLGFWYLKNHGADEQVEGMFDMGVETMDLPFEEKMKFEQGDGGRSCGYKRAGANAVDETGVNLDTVEFMNISKDDALAYPRIARREYPDTVSKSMESTVAPFVRASLDVVYALLNVFNDKLGLPKGTLARLHDLQEYSGSEARVIKNPPMPDMPPEKIALQAHTDFGSLSFLHNKLGGLQVLPPGHAQWSYIRPIPGHAICNVGDALYVFSGGVLQSNIHRVVPPPGAQGAYERWSLVFFLRPGDSQALRALVEDSQAIAEGVAKRPGKTFETGSTAAEWFARRIKNQRIKNWKGPETWKASRGTEHNEQEV